MRGLIADSGALDACERRIDDYVAQATSAVESPLIADDARAALSDLIVAATARKH